MRSFDFYSPTTLDEVYELLVRYQDDYAIIAGGTDIVMELNDRSKTVGNIININKVPALKGLSVKEGCVHIGAATTFTEVERNAFIRDNVKVLYQAAYGVGSPQIRNLGTVGGNLCNASVAGDSLGAFTALDADVVLGSKGGLRRMKLTEFYSDAKRTQLQKGEVMVEIIFDIPNANTVTAYSKLGRRKALAIVVLGICILLEADDAGVCTRAHLVIGAVARYPCRLPQIEGVLVGKKLSQELLYAQLPILTETVKEMIPTRDSVGYKSESVRGVARLAFDSALADMGIQ